MEKTVKAGKRVRIPSSPNAGGASHFSRNTAVAQQGNKKVSRVRKKEEQRKKTFRDGPAWNDIPESKSDGGNWQMSLTQTAD